MKMLMQRLFIAVFLLISVQNLQLHLQKDGQKLRFRKNRNMKKSVLVSKRKKRQDEVDLPGILEKLSDLEKELKVRFQDNCMSP